jgi:hypothetical protein
MAKAVPPSAFGGRGGGGVTFDAGQVAEMLAAQAKLSAGQTQAAQLPASPFWDTAPFGPGNRLVPAPVNVPRTDTQRPEPRLWEYPVSWNLQIADRHHVPWKTLQEAADMPLFRKCIERRKSVCQLDFTVTVDPKAVAREAQASGSAKTDVESTLRDKYMSEISRVTDWLQVPDRKNDLDWSAWTSLLMENRLKFDAAVVYPRRTYGGDVFAFEVIDGKTVKPLLDEYGGRPMPPYPAFQQILYGFPRGEFTATTDNPDGTSAVPGAYRSDQLYYERSIYRSESPYGMSATEIALLDGLVWMRRMGWIMAEYTEGVAPSGLLEVPETSNWTVTQWQDYSRALNDRLGGNTAERQKWPMLPPGLKLVMGEQTAERYKPDYDLFLIKLVAGDFGLPASEVGFTEAGALGASFHEGEEDILNRQTRRPDAQWLSNYATKLAIRELGMPGVLRVQILGLESEDEAAADAVAQARVASGRMTLNEDRARQGLPTYSFAEADMAQLQTGRGVVFLDGSSKQAPAGTLVGPKVAPPPGGAAPGQEGADGSQDPQQDDNEDDGANADARKCLHPRPELVKLTLTGEAVGAICPACDSDMPPSVWRKLDKAEAVRAIAAPPVISKAAEKAALAKWLARHPNPSRPFACKALTAEDVPDLAADPRVALKADGHPKALALSATGVAGSGTRSW